MGYCVTTYAYRRFLDNHGLNDTIDMELKRKPMASMRWEELWDAALRIRAAFLRTPVDAKLSTAIREVSGKIGNGPLVVRSSAVGEDSAERSFAGLHESVVGVTGDNALLDAVRVVWASLWSDAALLYRRELALDLAKSAMAVVVQPLIDRDRSGVGFGRDPRAPTDDRQIIEAVPGLCQDLVDGSVDPDRWIVRRTNGEIIEWRAGVRDLDAHGPLLERGDLTRIHQTLRTIETSLGWPPDVEWTGRGEQFTVLQARPITRPPESEDERQRAWYLSLRPGTGRLETLCKRVTEDLIPALKAEGRRLAAESIEHLSDAELGHEIERRADLHAKWKTIYWDEFIPFAHGVRQLGMYYNDAVKPADTYEFIEILRHQPMIATERNAHLTRLATYLHEQPSLHDVVRGWLSSDASREVDAWASATKVLRDVPGGPEFLGQIRDWCEHYMDVVYDGQSLDARPDLVLHVVAELAGRPTAADLEEADPTTTVGDCERRLLDAVGPDRHEEARSVIEIARLSWRLRDDDNVLLGRVEHQLLRALQLAADRLVASGRLAVGARIATASAPILAKALDDPSGDQVVLPLASPIEHDTISRTEGEAPRQIIGQPAAPGLATASACVIRTADDLARFRRGDVLICDAIQPTMSHIVPLAAAIVERRGGMLIHGAIVARELGIPCVNGVRDQVLSIADGEIVTVDGYLGIVTLGPPEFDLESVGPSR
jgi:pyruvate,water dikinase